VEVEVEEHALKAIASTIPSVRDLWVRSIDQESILPNQPGHKTRCD